ncbi:MAG: tyrosine-type recombinase/integrase [Patescibacteria group bacterium]|nr:tyrosine-type recombinase/integrase [Patescibacteria group bacterium]
MTMGRKRVHDRHLPRRMYQRRGAYYFVRADGKWEPLGRDYGIALKLWAERTGAKPEASIRTLADAFDRYLLEVVPKKAPKTQRGNRQQFKRLRVVFGTMRPDDLRAVHAYQYLDKLAATPVAANLEMALLKHVCRYLVRWGVLERHPLRDVQMLPRHHRDRDVQPDEFRAVYALASTRMQCAMELAVLTGLREGDILALRRDSVTADGLLVTTHKTGKRLLFEMTSALSSVIERLKALHGRVASIPLFTGRRGQALTSGGFQSEWKRLMTDATRHGIERFHFHDLRAMAAAESADPVKLLGHDSPTTTKIYLRRPVRVQPTR